MFQVNPSSTIYPTHFSDPSFNLVTTRLSLSKASPCPVHRARPAISLSFFPFSTQLSKMPYSIEQPVIAESSNTYIIVGAGVFGASTALHLKRTKPLAKVILIDSLQPNPAAASFDLNKIIRADYRDIFYMKLALEAQNKWQN